MGMIRLADSRITGSIFTAFRFIDGLLICSKRGGEMDLFLHLDRRYLESLYCDY